MSVIMTDTNSDKTYRTRQEIFDIVARHLLTQKEKSTNTIGSFCMYRGIRGLKCAIGALIPDEKYSPAFESCMVEEPEVCEAAGISYEDVSFARGIQCVHDLCEPAYWFTELLRFAHRYSLSADVLKDFDAA